MDISGSEQLTLVLDKTNFLSFKPKLAVLIQECRLGMRK